MPESGPSAPNNSSEENKTDGLRQKEDRREADHYHAVRRLAEIEAIYASAIMAFALIGADRRFVRVSRRFAELNGFTPAEHVGKALTEIHPEMGAAAEEVLEQVLSTGLPVLNREVRGDSAALPGVERRWRSQWIPLKDDEGRVVGVSVGAEELTDHKSVEDALRESEARLRAVNDNLPEAAVFRYRHDPEGNPHVDFISAGIERLTGVPASEYIRDQGNIERNILPEHHPALRAAIRESAERLTKFELEVRHRHRDTGEVRWSLLRSTPQRGPDGSIIWDGIELEITDRKLAEEALRESEEKLRSSFANAAIGFALTTPEGQYLDVNPSFCALTGFSLDELRTSAYQDVIHPDDRAEHSRLLADVMSGATRGFVTESRYVRKDGAVVWVRKSVSTIHDSEGSPKWFVSLTEDITARKIQEQALRESEMRLRTMAESNIIGVVFADPFSGAITGANDEFLRIIGRSRAELEAGTLNWKAITPENTLWRDQQAIAEALPEGRLGPFEKEYTRPDGTIAPVIVGGSFTDGDHASFVGFVLDITERKRGEERLRQAQKLESIGLLAGGIAHDFNNLLTGIMGNASLLREGAATGQEALIESILGSAERAAHLTRQLLAYSGKGQFVLRDLDISKAVTEMADLVQFSIPKNVRLKLDLERRLPQVRMDPGQLQQILINLVINGGEAIGEDSPGTVTVATSLAHIRRHFTDSIGEEITAGRYASIEVMDTGSGIAPENIARIFDPFFTTKFTGRGLGLAAVAGILRSHRGGMTVESTPEKGSTFRVLLPLTTAAPERAVEHPAGESRGTVLVVDDERSVRDFITAVLRRRGFRVLCAADGQEAVSVSESAGAKVELAVVDLVMPNMGAKDLLPVLIAQNPAMRVLLTSGYSESEARRLCATYPHVAFLQKPYTARQLGKAVSDLLEGE